MNQKLCTLWSFQTINIPNQGIEKTDCSAIFSATSLNLPTETLMKDIKQWSAKKRLSLGLKKFHLFLFEFPDNQHSATKVNEIDSSINSFSN